MDGRTCSRAIFGWFFSYFCAELRGMVSYSALKAVCSAGDDVARQRKALKKLFGSFVKCDKNVVRTQASSLFEVFL